MIVQILSSNRRAIISALAIVILQATNALAQVSVNRIYPQTLDKKGVIYFLPKTVIELEFTAEKTHFTPGELAPFAGALLGKEATLSSRTSTRIISVQIESKGVADESREYVVEFRPQTPASFVSLTHDGILVGINSEPGAEKEVPKRQQAEERVLPQPALPAEYAMASSPAMRAKIAAEQLFTLREDLLRLMSGKAENAPRDGEAFKMTVENLKGQVEAIEAIFYGTSRKELVSKRLSVAPEEEMRRHPVLNFSEEKGFLPAKQKGGSPILLDLQATRREPALSPEEEEKVEKRLQGVVYNVPGAALVRIVLPNGEVTEKEVPITQFGGQAVLDKTINRNKSDAVAVYFDPASGRLLQVNEIR